MNDRLTSGASRNSRRWAGRALLTGAAFVGCLVATLGGGRAFGALSTVGGGCGLHLGAPFQTGAAGSAGLEVPVYRLARARAVR
jgi:hypothetical protein